MKTDSIKIYTHSENYYSIFNDTLYITHLIKWVYNITHYHLMIYTYIFICYIKKQLDCRNHI